MSDSQVLATKRPASRLNIRIENLSRASIAVRSSFGLRANKFFFTTRD